MELNLKNILLKKIDSFLNPQFEKKFTWALFTLGTLLISYQNIIKFITSFELKYQEFLLNVSVEPQTDFFLKIVGAILVLIACYFFYKIFVNSKDKTKFMTLKQASCSIKKLLDDNKRIFKTHGPNSSSKNIDDLRIENHLQVWGRVKKEKIIPNNKKIYSMLVKVEVYQEDEVNIVESMKNHIEAFEGHIFNKDTDYSNYQFPVKFSSLIGKYCNNGILNHKYLIEYIEWINQYMQDNDIQNVRNKYLFGSVLYDKKPNDIDVLLYLNIMNIPDIEDTAKRLNQMKKDFKSYFNKHLHQTVFTINEKQNFNDFKNKLLDTKEF